MWKTYLHPVLDFSQGYQCNSIFMSIVALAIPCEKSEFSKINYDYLCYKKHKEIVVFFVVRNFLTPIWKTIKFTKWRKKHEKEKTADRNVSNSIVCKYDLLKCKHCTGRGNK